ncbi:phospholipase D-like domain-containing protein [Synechococcus sp. PCC 7336]|uniref:phospholipase D-like domain-containing protein n=1 Tax=Synechococcus sp. PCC 7336 TaxID=195250 RepID=UPI00035CF0A2|nr:phospholipase D-like domain-containing protein [Synechococcus sp. PCC 7336]
MTGVMVGWQWRRYVGLGLGLALLAAVGYWVTPSRTPESEIFEPIPPLPLPPDFRIAFNQARSHIYTDPYRGIQRYGDDLEAFLVEEIARARHSIAIAVQELNLPGVALALAERQRAGVEVRLILENTYTRTWQALTPAEVAGLDDRDRDKYREYWQLVDLDRDGALEPEEIAQRDALAIVQQAGVPWIDDRADGSQGSGLMHHKFLLVDGRTLVTGSANFTLSGIHGDFDRPESRGNANHLLAIESAELAAVFLAEFDLMWGDGPGGATDSLFGVRKPERSLQRVRVGAVEIRVHFSPGGTATDYADTSGGEIVRALSEATESVDLALFVFSDRDIAAPLLRHQQQRGIDIRGVFDRSFAYRDFSQTLALWNIRTEANCSLELAPASANGIGVPQLPQGDKLHHKFAIVDAALPGASVILGSHNWSRAANRINDETLLIISSAEIAAHFSREFDRLFSVAQLGPPQFLLANAAQPVRCLTPQQSRVVNLNTATPEQLEALPGIGPTLAQRIVRARPIRSRSDLEAIEGIGPAKLADLRGRVVW